MASVNPVPNPEEVEKSQNKLDVPSPAPEPGAPGKPFVITGRTATGGGKDNTKTILLGLGALVILLVAFFGLISTKGKAKHKTAAEAGKPTSAGVVTPSAPGQIMPSENAAAPVTANTKAGALDAHDIEKTKVPSLTNNTPESAATTGNQTTSSKATNGRALGQIQQFQPPDTDPDHMRNWGPAPYQGDHQDRSPSSRQVRTSSLGRAGRIWQSVHGLCGSPKRWTSEKNSSSSRPSVDNFGLASGYHVAARLESMASTALNAPVTAVVEYNYQRDGEVLIPAGARAIGKISQADASGIMNITFTAARDAYGREHSHFRDRSHHVFAGHQGSGDRQERRS